MQREFQWTIKYKFPPMDFPKAMPKPKQTSNEDERLWERWIQQNSITPHTDSTD